MTLSVMAATGARQHHAEIYTHWRYAIDISTFMPWTREHTYSLGTEIKETKQNVNNKKRNKIITIVFTDSTTASDVSITQNSPYSCCRPLAKRVQVSKPHLRHILTRIFGTRSHIIVHPLHR